MRLVYFIVFFLFSYFEVSAGNKIDTIDYWHIFYNDKTIAEYSAWPNNPPIKIKKSRIKPNDILTIKYGDDTPCSDCITQLYILDQKRRKVIIANGKGTWNPLKISMKEILSKVELYRSNDIDIYYHDIKRDHLIFRLKLE